MLAVLGGGCQVPIGAHATIEDGALHLRAIVISPDGNAMVKRRIATALDPAKHWAPRSVQELLDKGAARNPGMNKVYLVGAGPGDPELITLKGRRCLESADVVLYDHLAAPALLDFAPPAAERIYVGKKRGDHAYSQAEIIDLMVAKAREGKTVVRLKGGDPFIFGRGGEEVEALAEAGIPLLKLCPA